MLRTKATMFLIAGTSFITSCASTFKAVSATGALGQQIDGSVALGASSQICRDMKALRRVSAEACAAEEAAAGKWSEVADAMAAYATKLSALADKEDLDPSEQVSSALSSAFVAKWSKLSFDQNDAIASFAQAVAGALSMSYRAGVLDDVIQKVDPHIQRVGKLLAGEIDLRISQIDALSRTSGQVLLGLQSTPPARPLPAGSASSGARSTSLQLAAATKQVRPAQNSPPSPASASGQFEVWQRKVDDQFQSAIVDQAAVNQVLAGGAGAALTMVFQDLAAKKEAYLELKAKVAAFAASHAMLAQHRGDLAASDLLPQVVKVIQSTAALVMSMKPAAETAAANN